MKVLVCIDDTDNLESRGTGELAEQLSAEITSRSWGNCEFVTRHQLLVHPDVPYTSHNSSMCFTADISEQHLPLMIAHAGAFLENESAPGSDPGLAVAVSNRVSDMGAVVDFGQRAKQEVVKKQEAYDLAEALDIHLSEHGGTGHGGSLWSELVTVPWILAGPGIEPAVYSSPAQLQDVAPTLRALLGLPTDPRSSGTALLGIDRAGTRLDHGPGPAAGQVNQEMLLHMNARQGAFRTEAYLRGDWKLLQLPDAGENSLRLYDLAADPAERTDLAAQRPEQLRELQLAMARRREQLAARGDELRGSAAPVEQIPAALKDQLRELGYAVDED